jgi:DNA (cytosine-5)-methyltransferase 1
VKILNLYAGIGGNRALWADYQITAVEYDDQIAAVYADRFPDDRIVIQDAHQYLVDHYTEFDFIWTSPPCQSHSSFRQNIGVRYRGVKAVYPDMRLYQEIIFLQHNFKGKWVVENVKPYYDPLIEPSFTLQRHLFWSNFEVPEKHFDSGVIRNAQIPDLQQLHNVDLSQYNIPNKRQILRNCVIKEVGEWIIRHAV